MPVSTKHPDYINMLPRWELMRDILNDDIKSKGEKYLPKTAGQIEIESKDPSCKIYNSYKDRAEFPLWVTDSSRSMVGLVARLDIKCELPKKLEAMRDKATADGFNINQLFMRCVKDSLTFGRQALLVDVDHDGMPYIAVYDAFSPINWKSTNNNGRKDLTLVVLSENWLKENNDEFSHDTEQVYRVLDINDGSYRVRLFDKDGSLTETKEDTLNKIGIIPIVFVGSTDNSPDIDEIPLLTMAKSSIKYYKLSADYYHDLHLTCHPQAWIAGLDDKNSIEITGSSIIWNLPVDARCGYLEISGTGINANKEAMADQKNSALESGARVIDISRNESGNAREARQNDQHATLHSVVSVVASGIEQTLKNAAEAVGANKDEVKFEVTIDFKNTGVDTVILTNLFNAVMADKISMNTYWEYLQTGKLPERDYLDEVDLIGQDTDRPKLDE